MDVKSSKFKNIDCRMKLYCWDNIRNRLVEVIRKDCNYKVEEKLKYKDDQLIEKYLLSDKSG